MKLVEAFDRCLGHYEAHLATQTPSPLIRRSKSYRHPTTRARSVSQSYDTPSSSTNQYHTSSRETRATRGSSLLSSPQKSTKFPPSTTESSSGLNEAPTTRSKTHNRCQSHSDASRSSGFHMISPLEELTESEFSIMDHHIYDHHKKVLHIHFDPGPGEI